MCGIIAGRSQSPILPKLLQGLKSLEYRGYDSFGLMTQHRENIQVKKHLGAPSTYNLKSFQALNGTEGMGHTRWATHGRVTHENAHPHLLEYGKVRLALVHNGVVENLSFFYQALPKEIKSLLRSQTDSEVLGAYMLYLMTMKQHSIIDAFERTCSAIEGHYALITSFITPEQSCYLAQRHVLSLYVTAPRSSGTEEQFLCSDSAGFPVGTEQYYKLAERQTFRLGQAPSTLGSCLNYTQQPRSEAKAQQLINCHMEAEIAEQPEVIRHLIKTTAKESELSGISGPWDCLDFLGCGSSYHAAQIGAYWFEKQLGCITRTFVASEYKYQPAPVYGKKTMIVVLSQSGETADILTLLPKLKSRYDLIVALCNNSHSSLAEQADKLILLEAGPEIGVASTKAYSAQVFCLLKLLHQIQGQRQLQDFTQQEETLKLPQKISQTLTLQSIQQAAIFLSRYKHFLLLSRGPLLAVAQEGALKIKEVAYIHAQAIATGEMKHGSLALIDESCPVIILINNDHFKDKNILACQELLARQALLIVIVDETITLPFSSQLFCEIKVPSTHPHFEALLYSIPLQVLAFEIGKILGRNVDRPRNLAKSVTVE